MNRAERRRKSRETETAPVYKMTVEQLKQFRDQEFDRARKLLSDTNTKVAADIMRMMLVIPVNVLVSDYWQKTARTRIPKFVEDCMSLYKAWETGAVDMEDMQKLAEEYSGIRLLDDDTPVGRATKRGENRR